MLIRKILKHKGYGVGGDDVCINAKYVEHLYGFVAKANGEESFPQYVQH